MICRSRGQECAVFVAVQFFIAAFFVQSALAQLNVWANDGADKVTQDELRLTKMGSAVNNLLWNGSQIQVFGAKNEVISFNLILEAPGASVSNVSLKFDQLNGPGGSTIGSTSTSGDGVFDWRDRNIELFYVRYLQIKGLSTNTFSNYDERHTPERIRRPWSGPGYASGSWYDRPDHNKYYPDIAVPMELIPSFSIAASSNQSIWADIYIPKNARSGLYTGNIQIFVNAALTYSIPVELQVRNFTLPDVPVAKTMVVVTPSEINRRYFGSDYINPLGGQGAQSILTRQRHFMLAHRHKISLVDTNYEYLGDQPAPYEWLNRLDGSLFTPAHGYDGPGVGKGNDIFSIGLYGSWNWKWQDQSSMRLHTDNWERWFQINSPGTERFLYLDDESHNYSQLQQWASWIKNNPGPGSNLLALATVDLPIATQSIPDLTVPASTIYIGDPNRWGTAHQTLKANSKNRFVTYNGHRPASGTFAIEDDGVSPRQVAWTQYKMKIDRWMYWQSTYYNNTQNGIGQTNVFHEAQTFGSAPYFDSTRGMTSDGFSNGDGVLFYPGTDRLFPSDSYNVNGPLSSLRLKHWRRGIQDVDYLTMAAEVNPEATKKIVEAVIPKVLWEYGVDDPYDPSWKRTDISWSNDPDVWEQARASLAEIIDGRGLGMEAVPTPIPGEPSIPALVNAPSNLLAAAFVSNQLVLNWKDESINESAFKLERSIDGVNFTEVATISANLTSHVDLGLNAWTTYAYRIRAINNSRTSTYSGYAYATTLTTSISRPELSAPTALSARAALSNQLLLTWNDASNNESGFKIERSSDGTNFNEIASLGSNVTTYTDNGLSTWTTYAYRVVAFSGSTRSNYSNYAHATTLTSGSFVPSAPESLSAVTSGSNQLLLSWQDTSGSEDGFKVERSMDGVNFREVGSVSGNVTSFNDSGLNNGTTYAYRVRAYNNSGSSAHSNTVYKTSVASGTIGFNAPSALVATLSGTNRVVLSWKDNSSNETGFRIERSTDGNNFTTVNTPTANSDTFTDTSVARWMTYVYRVRALNGAALSGASNTIYISTPQ